MTIVRIAKLVLRGKVNSVPLSKCSAQTPGIFSEFLQLVVTRIQHMRAREGSYLRLSLHSWIACLAASTVARKSSIECAADM